MDKKLVYVKPLGASFEVYGVTQCACGETCFVVEREGGFDLVDIDLCIPVNFNVPPPVTKTPTPKFEQSNPALDKLKEMKKVWPDKQDRDEKIERFKRRVDAAAQLEGLDIRGAMMLFYDGGKQG